MSNGPLIWKFPTQGMFEALHMPWAPCQGMCEWCPNLSNPPQFWLQHPKGSCRGSGLPWGLPVLLHRGSGRPMPTLPIRWHPRPRPRPHPRPPWPWGIISGIGNCVPSNCWNVSGSEKYCIKYMLFACFIAGVVPPLYNICKYIRRLQISVE